MASNNTIYCGPCESRHVTKTAVVWCPNCEEGLCYECLEHHKVSKASRQHKTTSVECFKNLPDFVRNSNQICTNHGELIELYCGVHQAPCCIGCINDDHSGCPGVTSLKKIVHGVKESSFYYDIEKNVQNTISFLEELKNGGNENLAELQEQRGNLAISVKTLREDINAHLNKLENVLIQEIGTVVNGESEKLRKIMETVQSKWSKFTNIQNDISKIFENATELQAYFGLKYIEKEMVSEEKDIVSIFENERFQKIKVNLEMSDEMKNLLTTFKCFGKIKVHRAPTNIHTRSSKLQFPQIHIGQTRSVENIRFDFLKRFEIPESDQFVVNICSCVFLPNGRIIMANNNVEGNEGELFIFNQDGSYEKKSFYSSIPFGVAVFGNMELAVSFNTETCIRLYDIEDMSYKRKITGGGGYHFGLCYHDNHLASAARGTGISFVDLSGTVSKILPVNVRQLNYIHVTGNRVYYTIFQKNILCCLNEDGNELWKCTFDNMKGPRNVCTDYYGNIFVAASDSNNILVVSPDGKTCKELLGVQDGMVEPKSVCFDASGLLFLVANKHGPVFLYKVKYI